MKSNLFLLFALMATMSFAQKHQVDVKTSSVLWHAEKFTGEHDGTVQIKSGEIELKKDALVGGNLVIDMTTIKCTDIEGEWSDKLVRHLKSPDFFGVEKFPTSNIMIESVAETKEGEYDVRAVLTIKGISQPMNFKASLTKTEKTIQLTATLIIDRSKFDVRYGSSSFFDDLGDKTIYDEFTMKVDIKAAK